MAGTVTFFPSFSKIAAQPRAEPDWVFEPGVLPVELHAHLGVEIPVEPQGHLSRAQTGAGRVGQGQEGLLSRGQRHKHIIANRQVRHPRHELPGPGRFRLGLATILDC
jgi:hypothetical protein